MSTDSLFQLMDPDKKGIFNSLIFISVNLTGTIFCIFLIMTFIIYPSTRKSPGDILLSLSVTDFFKCFVLLLNSCYWLLQGVVPDEDSLFCDASAVISILAYVGNGFYSCWFCMSITKIIKGQLVVKKKMKYWIHALIVTAAISCAVLIITSKTISPNMFGICDEQTEKGYFLIMDLLVNMIIVIVSFKTQSTIQKHIPLQSKFAVQKLEMSKYYSKYVRVIRTYFILKILIVIVFLLFLLSMKDSDVEHISTESIILFVLLVIMFLVDFVLQVLQPILLTIVRAQDPIIRPKLKRIYYYLCKKQQVSPQNRDENWYQLLTANIKSTLLNTILHGLVEITSLKDIKLREIEQLRISQCETLLEMEVYHYYPKLFNQICCRDRAMINIVDSLCPEKNQDQIQSFAGPDGGKSGEFFLFTSDNKLILKTITQEELDSLIEIIEPYTNYLISNETLLSIFYGIYTFQRYDMESDPIHIVIQRNVAQVSSPYLTKVYDLKGSELAREVKIDMSKKLQTLKDKNFEQIEGRIKIDKLELIRIGKIIERDVLFLKDLGFMDYSLLVMKANWQLYCHDNETDMQQIKDRFSNQLHILESTEEKGVYYHIAIIDYLQKWNIQKIMEKTSKKLLYGEDANQSAVDPNQYAERFIKKIVEQYIHK